MEFHIRRTTPAAPCQFRNVRVNRQPVEPRSAGRTQALFRPQERASTDLRIQGPPAEDHTPSATSPQSERRMRRLFTAARRKAKARARLSRLWTCVELCAAKGAVGSVLCAIRSLDISGSALRFTGAVPAALPHAGWRLIQVKAQYSEPIND
jgi:hypothetical protein